MMNREKEFLLCFLSYVDFCLFCDNIYIHSDKLNSLKLYKC